MLFFNEIIYTYVESSKYLITVNLGVCLDVVLHTPGCSHMFAKVLKSKTSVATKNGRKISKMESQIFKSDKVLLFHLDKP